MLSYTNMLSHDLEKKQTCFAILKRIEAVLRCRGTSVSDHPLYGEPGRPARSLLNLLLVTAFSVISESFKHRSSGIP